MKAFVCDWCEEFYTKQPTVEDEMNDPSHTETALILTVELGGKDVCQACINDLVDRLLPSLVRKLQGEA